MRVMQGADFATVARENSEDSDTRLKGGDWRYFTEEQMKQTFPQGFAEAVMSMNNGDIFRQLIPFENRYLIIKLQRKQETDEDRTLETPGVKQEITDILINSRKQLLAASYQAIAMNEARVENFLAKKVVDNPNELSGARPAGVATPIPSPSNTNTATPAASNTTNGNTNARPAASTSNANRPAANSNR
jgi:Parvulin-like peptidyl-prolyl isomerase